MDQDKEIDLRPLVLALVRNWYVFLIGLTLAALGAWWWSTRAPLRYHADAQVVVVSTKLGTDFESRVDDADFESRVTVDESLPDRALLTAGLVQLANSGTVLQGTIEQLGDQLPPELRNLTELGQVLTLSEEPRTGLITLHATHPDSAVAVRLVNAWAAAFIVQGNQVYGSARGTPVLQALQAKHDAARESYQRAEQELAAFVASDESPTLEQRVGEYETAIESLRMARTRVVSETAASDAIQATELISTYTSLRWSGQTAALSAAQQQQIDRLNDDYAALRRLEQVRRELVALRAHLAAGGNPQSAFLTLQLLMTRAFASDQPPAEARAETLQLQVPVNGQATVADIDAIVAAIDPRIEQLRADIATQSAVMLGGTVDLPADTPATDPAQAEAVRTRLAELLSNSALQSIVGSAVLSSTSELALAPDDALAQLQQQLQRMESRLIELQAERFVREQERDTARAAYTSLGLKIAELSGSNQLGEQVVRLGSNAVVAAPAAGGGALRPVLLAMVSTLVLLVAIVLGRELLVPFLQASPHRRRSTSAPPETS
jgi:capsular polysaccharide biosynthesis protein